MLRRTTVRRGRAVRKPVTGSGPGPGPKRVVRPSPPTGPLAPQEPGPDPRTEPEKYAAYQRWVRIEEEAKVEKAKLLKDLSRPEVYRDEAGYASFEAYLEARKLPTRGSTSKWFRVIGVFGTRDVVAIGGMEKAYYAIMAQQREKPGADPRELLKPGAKVMGQVVASVSSRWLRAAKKRVGRSPDVQAPGQAGPRASDECKLAARRLRRGLERLAIAAKLRAHLNDEDVSVVTAHFETKPALRMVDLLKHAQRSGFT